MSIEGMKLTVEDWSSLHARLLWCYQGVIAPSNRKETTRDRRLTAWWMQAGMVTVKSRGRSVTAGAGEWLFSGPEPREQSFTAKARLLSLNFQLEWPSGDSLVEPFLAVSSGENPALGEAAKPLVALLRREFPGVRVDLWGLSASPTVFFRLQQFFSAWVLAYLETVLASGVLPARMNGVDPRVQTALRNLDRHSWDRRFCEDELAREVGLSVGHLDRLFVQQMGATPRGYLQKRRLEAARAMLREPLMAIKEVAYELGFSSPAHFCHWFRQAAGCSPRGYRSAKNPAVGCGKGSNFAASYSE
jgi:AraC-like DNA-binding protein